MPVYLLIDYYSKVRIKTFDSKQKYFKNRRFLNFIRS